MMTKVAIPLIMAMAVAGVSMKAVFSGGGPVEALREKMRGSTGAMSKT
jgi:hypothetical protein